MSYFTTADGCKLYYEEHGKGEPLIFIHGWSCNSKYFKKQVAYFSKKYRVVAYDLRGHGESDKGEVTEQNMNLARFGEDLHELIEGLGIDKANLVGWSMGTSTLFAYIRKFGCQYINKLCIIDMIPKLITDDEWKLGTMSSFTHADNLNWLSMIAADWNTLVEHFTPNIFGKGYPKDSELFKWSLGEARKNVPHVMAFMWLSMSVEDFRPVLKDIAVPTLLAFGGDGLLHTRAHGEYMEQNIKNSKLVLFPGCGHGPFLDAPDAFNAELEAFLTE
ncbi:MAG: alpha/beta hydrolase [Clostridiales Family XIII bacterium]|jgi:pimeloyl-ACP methyl ester carboxylesterase|nr:alpha/beta hydrolase [Clostridiales Family XIII bacterium]